MTSKSEKKILPEYWILSHDETHRFIKDILRKIDRDNSIKIVQVSKKIESS